MQRTSVADDFGNSPHSKSDYGFSEKQCLENAETEALAFGSVKASVGGLQVILNRSTVFSYDYMLPQSELVQQRSVGKKCAARHNEQSHSVAMARFCHYTQK